MKKVNTVGHFGTTSQTEVPIRPIFAGNGLDCHCCLAGSSKIAPRILILSIAMGADYSFEVKNIQFWAPTVFNHSNSLLATARIA